MFGRDGENTSQNTNDTSEQTVQPSEPVDPTSQPAAPAQTGSDNAWQHPGTPLVFADPSPVPGPQTSVLPTDNHTTAPSGNPGDDTASVLIDIKQQALGQLSPLLSHLEQSPEDKFRTLLMMIQASDDQSLVKSAYEAANAIQDEKAKAQALLDIVNEINYFTAQQHQDPQSS